MATICAFLTLLRDGTHETRVAVIGGRVQKETAAGPDRAQRSVDLLLAETTGGFHAALFDFHPTCWTVSAPDGSGFRSIFADIDGSSQAAQSARSRIAIWRSW